MSDAEPSEDIYLSRAISERVGRFPNNQGCLLRGEFTIFTVSICMLQVAIFACVVMMSKDVDLKTAEVCIKYLS